MGRRLEGAAVGSPTSPGPVTVYAVALTRAERSYLLELLRRHEADDPHHHDGRRFGGRADASPPLLRVPLALGASRTWRACGSSHRFRP